MKKEILGPTYGPGSPMVPAPTSGDMNLTSADKDMMGGDERPAVVPATSPVGNGKMIPTKGPSHKGIGNIPHKTKSHSVPGRKEMKSEPVGSGVPSPINHSGADRQSADPVNKVPTKWHKKGYSMDVPSALPAGNLKKKWEQ
jgi:hypothetical protein